MKLLRFIIILIVLNFYAHNNSLHANSCHNPDLVLTVEQIVMGTAMLLVSGNFMYKAGKYYLANKLGWGEQFKYLTAVQREKRIKRNNQKIDRYMTYAEVSFYSGLGTLLLGPCLATLNCFL